MVICAGLDLAAREHKPSGVSIIRAENLSSIKPVFIATTRKNHEILRVLVDHGVSAVAVDAPLSLPQGSSNYREVDRKMIKLGYRVFPPGWKYMKELTLRAIELSRLLAEKGVKTVETHPLSALKSSRCSSIVGLLESVGIVNLDIHRMSSHELDALIASIVCAYFYFERAVLITAPDGNVVLLPPLC